MYIYIYIHIYIYIYIYIYLSYGVKDSSHFLVNQKQVKANMTGPK